MVYGLYLKKLLKVKDKQKNVTTTQSSIFSFRQEKSHENHRKICSGMSPGHVHSLQYWAGHLFSDTESILQLVLSVRPTMLTSKEL